MSNDTREEHSWKASAGVNLREVSAKVDRILDLLVGPLPAGAGSDPVDLLTSLLQEMLKAQNEQRKYMRELDRKISAIISSQDAAR
jgi:hypothetical protein